MRVVVVVAAVAGLCFVCQSSIMIEHNIEKQQCVGELADRQTERQAGHGSDHFGLRAIIAFCAVTVADVAGEET